MIALKETDKELLLFIPAPHKERARAIAGYRWNPNRRCWVYPKTSHVYDALLAEFRDDLTEVAAQRPVAGDDIDAAADEQRRLAKENERLRQEIAALRAQRSAASAPVPDTTLLNRALAARDREIAALRKQLEHAAHASAGGGQAAPAGDSHQQFIAFFRTLALDAAGRDRGFKAILTQLTSLDAFPATLRDEITVALSRRLAVATDAAVLADLVVMATLAGTLSPQGGDLALLIDRLGSEAAPDAGASAVWVRGLLALYAAALLWPEVAA